MPDDKPRFITTASKSMFIVIGIETTIIIILIASGFKQINPYLLLLTLLIVISFIYFYLRKPKVLDIYKILKNVKQRHYEATGFSLDTRDFQATAITQNITELYLPKEGVTFEIINNLVGGLNVRHLYKVIKEKEKSRLFELTQRYLGAESKLKQSAEALKIDIESLGLSE